MIEIKIDNDLKNKIPKLSLGIIQSQVLVLKENEQLWETEINKSILNVSTYYDLKSINNIEEIKALKLGYKIIGKDPTRYRGSAEALIRRIIQCKGLYKVNTIVDINNLVSIESMYSIGSYDLNQIQHPISFRIGYQGESYKGIGKNIINIAGLPVFVDKNGPFGSPTSDSERAMITETTKEIIMVIISFNGKEQLTKYINRITNLLIGYANATKEQVETQII